MEVDYLKYVHYWKKQVSDKRLQAMLDSYKQNKNSAYTFDLFTILLKEKLRRVESEIAIL